MTTGGAALRPGGAEVEHPGCCAASASWPKRADQELSSSPGMRRTWLLWWARALCLLVGLLLLALAAGCGEATKVAPRALTHEYSPAGSGCGPTFGPYHAGLWPDGCWRPYSSASPFNQPLPAHPELMHNSRAIVASVLASGPASEIEVGARPATALWGHPIYYAQTTDPLYRVHCTYSAEYGPCGLEGVLVHVPAGAQPSGGSDAHMAVIDQQTGWEYDMWRVHRPSGAGGRLVIGYGGRTRIDGTGLGSAATAADFALGAGIIRAQELEDGNINHALFMTVPCVSRHFVYPAQGNGWECGGGSPAPPMGARFQLAMSPAQIARLPVPGWKKTILRAMARYGMFVGDTGGSGWSVYVESGQSYWSFGVVDPMLTFAQQVDAPYSRHRGQYLFDLQDGVNWARYLRIVAPCVTRANCR